MLTRLRNERETVAFGRRLGACLGQGGRIYIQGDLGAGKTTLCRGILRQFGYEGAVKSPTFTIVEPYELADLSVYHFDLYRLADPNELEYLGIDDYFAVGNLCLVEWPERGADALPECDLNVTLRVVGKTRSVELRAGTQLGERIISLLEATAE
jgi:tRNA threonylcarbamoyladenosine biosynthesis protein TsaE